MKKIVLVFVYLLFAFMSFGQFYISSKILDGETNEPVENVSVRLLNVKDSTLIKGDLTDEKGLFSINPVKSGSYLLNFTYVGYQSQYKKVEVLNKDLVLEDIILKIDDKVLKELEVQGTTVQVVVKKDTIEYNAKAFKTSENVVVEELLKKMPGVEVDADGNIKVNGESITKVTVDSKKFFDGDTQMATKNIPANLINKVQVFEEKSEMSKLTGFDDGDRKKVLNLSLKDSKKHGVFGNIEVGGGIDIDSEFRYDASTFLNFMNGDTRSTVLAGTNNANSSRSSRGMMSYGGGGSGISETHDIGLDINTPIGEKITLGGDASFNHSDNMSISESKRESYMQGGTYTSVSNSSRNFENYSSYLRFELEWKPDTMTTIRLQPNVNYSRNYNNSSSEYLYLQETDSTSWGNSNNNSESSGFNGGLNLLYNKKFKKQGRRLTMNFDYNNSTSKSDGLNLSAKHTDKSLTTIDQRSSSISDGNSLALRISYVEPLWEKNHFIQIATSLRGSFQNSDRSLFDKDVNGVYSILDEEYSNEFQNRNFNEEIELNYQYEDKDYSLRLGMKAVPSQTYNQTKYGDKNTYDINNNVVNFAPSAQIRYKIQNKNYFRLSYNGRTRQPSVQQMQPVKNNTDLMNETVGNPGLKPSFNHRLMINYSDYNEETFSSFNFGLHGSITKDELTSNSIYDKTGKRYVQTVNANELPYSLNMYGMYTKPFFKKLNFSNQFSLGMNQQYGYTSKNVGVNDLDLENLMLGDLSNTAHYNASEFIGLSYSHDKFDIQTRAGLRYSISKNNFNKADRETYDWSGYLNLVIRPIKNFSISGNIDYTKQIGYSDFNPQQWLWNGVVEYTAFKGKGVFAFQAFDILRQRQNVFQTVGDNYIQYSSTNSLPSYYLLSFTYNINKFNGGDKKGAVKMNKPHRSGQHRGRARK